jgi:hypothetical protein
MATGKKDAEVLLVASPVGNSSRMTLPATSQHRAIPAIRRLEFTSYDEEAAGFDKPRQTNINFPPIKTKTRKDPP